MTVFAVVGCGDAVSPKHPTLRLEKNSPDSQVFAFGSTPTLSPSVRVTDLNGRPVAGVTVHVHALLELIGPVISDSNGVATVPEWRPRYAGVNGLAMFILHVDTVYFTATGRCVANQSISLGVPVSGTLSGGDCESLVYCPGYCLLTLEDRFVFEASSALTVKMQATGSDNALVRVGLFDREFRELAFSIFDASSSAYRPFWVIIPPGSYEIAVSGFFPPASYELAIDGPVSDPGCEVLIIVRGTTISQGLDSLDCVDQSRYVDSFDVDVRFGQTVTVSLASTAFASVLELQHTNYFLDGVLRPAQRTTGSPGVPAQLSASCNVDQLCTFRIAATSSTTLTTGAYTLSVQ